MDSALQRLGQELDDFKEDVELLLPDYTNAIFYQISILFEELVSSNTTKEEELVYIAQITDIINDIRLEWRGILSES